MNNDDVNNANSTSNGQAIDASGKPVNVVERDLEDREGPTKGVDEVFTPSSIRTKEQEIEELKKKTDAIEREVADGN